MGNVVFAVLLQFGIHICAGVCLPLGSIVMQILCCCSLSIKFKFDLSFILSLLFIGLVGFIQFVCQLGVVHVLKSWVDLFCGISVVVPDSDAVQVCTAWVW